MNTDVVVLAAGKGTRMRSEQAKVLHTLAGKSLLQHVLDTAHSINPREIAVVVGHQAEQVQASVAAGPKWVLQNEQRGTGHAVQLGAAALGQDGVILVLYGDVPLVTQDTLARTVEAAKKGAVALVTAHFKDPAQLGRIVRDDGGNIAAIVEFKDADDTQRQINEINSGILAAPATLLTPWLAALQPNNAQGELYLTDVIAMAVADGVTVTGIEARAPVEVTGVNDRAQLAALERVYQQNQAAQLMAQGVSLADPNRFDLRGRLIAGEDCFIDVNVVFSGEVVLGRGVRIGPGAVIADSVLGDHVEVHAHTVVEGAAVAAECSLGPFARIRPGTRLDSGVKIGNFVEVKKSHLGAGTKASHLAYLGDATIGKECNIGAGTVTCNYDGISKHPTTIGDDVFVGTNSTLVAPLHIDSGAFIAAGSSITTKVSSGELAVGRGKQRNIKGWVRPDKRKGKQ
ncbi:MAG: bifunctional UDP-N-acetylglucosamine diphosphorylase/glucosamine-1-phosphate N-acetyltransferase GlmU [bacterium]